MTRFRVRDGSDLGRAISQIRSDVGMTQAALGRATGLSAAYLSQIETGRTVSLLEHELRVLRRLGARVIVEWDASDGEPA